MLNGIPALTVHDEFIVREQDAELAAAVAAGGLAGQVAALKQEAKRMLRAGDKPSAVAKLKEELGNMIKKEEFNAKMIRTQEAKIAEQDKDLKAKG